MRPLRLAVFPDFPEEGWPSMDLCAEMLLAHLPAGDVAVQASRVCPPFRRRFRHFPFGRRGGGESNVDRLLNRFWDYPMFVRGVRDRFDAFHVCDHSYAQLLHALPAGRGGVYCHDLDAFRCLVEPARDRRPRWFRAMARRIVRGLQKARVVFYNSQAVRGEIERHGLIDPARLVYAPYGPAPEFSASAKGDEDPPEEAASGPYLLHVGSCIPRKRIDVLLEVFARARARFRGLRLIKVGGDWTAAQREQIGRLGLDEGAIHHLHGVSRRRLAGLYRRAAVVLQPSEAEGFGLPVLEALACGAAVLASDLPVLREVGGAAAVYCPVADVEVWADTLCRLLDDPARAPDRAARLARARKFSWAAHAQTIAAAYQRLS